MSKFMMEWELSELEIRLAAATLGKDSIHTRLIATTREAVQLLDRIVDHCTPETIDPAIEFLNVYKGDSD